MILSVDYNICLSGKVHCVTDYNSVILPSTEKPLTVGLDPSTRCTGIAVTAGLDKVLMLGEVVNVYGVPKQQYLATLSRILSLLLREANVERIVFAEPYGGNVYLTLQEVNTFLKTNLRLKGDFPIVSIKDNVARRYFFDLVDSSRKGKMKRAYVKEAIMRASLEIDPRYSSFVPYCSSKDYDAFDALAICLGYLKANEPIGGVPRINTTMRYHRTPKYSVSVIKDTAVLARDYPGIPVLEYNTEFSIEENASRGIADRDEFIAVIPRGLESLILSWEYGVWLKQDEYFLLYSKRRRKS